ncbi:MAG: hypothetical protein GTO55_02405 [Armatimonadetes bacterium]|nr:hypothetical protein [Armatimonadota bacterium]NIM23131.1 hypothetical protein [Armatimonadota bacterium]NIM66999.1 hypothetical protein [Armatimonadota bacterium]NIM75533.1 hypothetical protein [Armatimonadota bacterium]NIN05188.1 hypothetical protein [Armatimonadota bacterium]
MMQYPRGSTGFDILTVGGCCARKTHGAPSPRRKYSPARPPSQLT